MAFATRDRALATVRRFCDAGYEPEHETVRCRYAWGCPGCATGGWKPPDVQVRNADVIDTALEMRDPLVLILADADVPGGCVHAGGGMQEESLFRRTALIAHLRPWMYPIAPDEALYARGVPVLLGSEAAGFPTLPAPQPRLSFVACPGVKMPALEGGRLSREDAAVLRRKVRLILQVARTHGHDEVVLGALGCGVWGCPAKHVAQIFGEVLTSEQHGVRTVRFAILGALASVFRDELGVVGSC